MGRPPCQPQLASRARTPREVRACLVGAASRSLSCPPSVPLKLNEPPIRFTAIANSGVQGFSSSSSMDLICGAIASSASPITNRREST